MLANYIFSEKFVKYLRSRDKQGKGSKYPSNGTSHLTDQSWTMWLGRLLSNGNLETVDTIMYWTVTTIWWENWTYKETSWECFVRDCHYDLRIYCFFLRELGVATSTCWSSNFSNTPTSTSTFIFISTPKSTCIHRTLHFAEVGEGNESAV